MLLPQMILLDLTNEEFSIYYDIFSPKDCSKFLSSKPYSKFQLLLYFFENNNVFERMKTNLATLHLLSAV